MLRLFAGRENIDKEAFIYDSIVAAGGGTFVLVPDQYTLVAEEQALKHLGTECLFDVEILSMNRLGLRVLTEQGTESVRMLDKYGRFMLLSRIVREHIDDFDIFRRSAGKLSFTAMLNDFISEFKQQDCSLDELGALLDDSGDDPVLGAKIKELSGVIEAYEKAIEDRYTDSEDYIARYVKAIKDSELVRGRNFWIYGYDSITPKFADAVMELSASAASVNFIINRSDFGLDKMLEATLVRLAGERGISVSCEEIGPAYARPGSETVSRIEKYLWKDVLSAEEREANRDFVPADLTLVSAANPYYEAENAAAYVWHLIRDLGYKMREIQLIANDEGGMQPVVRRVFAEYGLDVFADTSRDITDSAAVGFIINLLDFVKSRGLSQHLFAALKTGLGGFCDEDIESLENYVRSYRVRGSMWDKEFRYGADDIGEEALEYLNEMRQQLSSRMMKLKKLASCGKVSGFTAEFRKYLEDEWDLSERVSSAADAQDEAGLHDEAQRMSQSYETAIEMLAQIDEVMGDTDMDLAEFTDIYMAGLSDAEVGVIPPSADGLSMGTMIRTRPRQMRAVVILGANEGVLPLSPSTEGLFSVDEKEYFRSKGFALGRLDDVKMAEENAAMYRMMARPSEKIYMSWSATDIEGGDASPSPVIDSLAGLFPKTAESGFIRPDLISAGEGDKGFAGTELINTPGASMRHLINHIKDGGSEAKPDALTRALLKWYSDNRADELKTMLDAAAYDNDPKPLGRHTAKALFGRKDGRLVMSASSIGSYIDCPFKYFVDRGLRPREERTFSSDARSVGDVYHECLMAVAGQLMADSSLMESVRDGDDEKIEALVSAALDEISGSYRGGLFISTGSEEYRMSRIREICAAAATAMARQLTAESVTGAGFEEAFGRHGRFEPVRLDIGGDEVLVEGRIDRADYMEIDGEKRVRIIDYKTGADKLDISKLRSGIRMQLMIYMISASSGELRPAGMFYFNIRDNMSSVNDKSEAQQGSITDRDPADDFRLKGAYIDEEGVLEAMPPEVLASSKGGIGREEYEAVRRDVLARIEETASGILSGRIGINPLKEDKKLVCGWCSYKSVCRRDRGYTKNYARTPKQPAQEEGGETDSQEE